tara:strand:+ start:51 stop:305 length:255 start_codon:yes stop_codon:yes gene_type:complete
MYNNDDIMSKMTEQAWLIEQLESTVTNLTTKIDILLDSDLAIKSWLKRNQEKLDELTNSVKPIEIPEFQGTMDALENLTIRKSV